MIFSNFTRTEVGTKIIFKNNQPIQNVGSIKFYKDDATGTFVKKEFRWSFNKNYWSSWESLNQGNLSGLDVKNNPFFYLEIRYVSSGSGKVTKFSLNYFETSSNISPLPAEESCIVNETIIDANLLNGQPGSYYLWRPNHKGEQPISSVTGLQKILTDLSNSIQNNTIKDALNVSGPGIGVYYGKEDATIYFKKLIEGNKIFITETPAGKITLSVDDASINELFIELGSINGINVGGGPGEIFKQRTGNDFEFRTIAAGNANVTVTTVGDQVRIGLDASASGAPIWTDTDPISADVGGVSGGTFIDTSSNSIEILEKILYEYFPPNVNLNLDPSSGYYEKYDPTTLTDVSIYGTFNNNKFVKVDITDVSAYATVLGGIGTISYSDVSNGSFEFNDGGFNSNWDDIVYSVKVYHKVGTDIMQPKEASAAINFVLPYIWGIVDDTVNISNIDASIIENFHSLGQKRIVPKQSNEIDFNRPSGLIKAKFVYAYDASYGKLNSIFDVKNDFNITTSFDTSIINIDLGVQSNIPYRVYIKNHWIDVSTFKIIFNI